MAKRVTIGAYSAYALAVKHGFVGTEAEWATVQAEAGKNGQLAASSALAAKNAQAGAEKAEQGAAATKDAALQEIENAKTSSVSAVNATKDEAVQAVKAQQNASVAAVDAQEKESKQAVKDQQGSSVAAVGAAETKAIGSVNAVETEAVASVQAERTTAVNSVTAEKETAVNAVKAESESQIVAIQQTGENVSNSIPQDYTALVGNVNQLASDLLTKAPAINCETSGNMVSITDAAAQPAVSLISHIEPVQAGSGDPSPDNVRPISGWDEAVIHRRGNNLCPPFTIGMSMNDITGTPKEGMYHQAITDFIPVNFGTNDAYIWSNIIDNLFNCVYFYNQKKEYLGRSNATFGAHRKIDKTVLTANLTGVGGEIGYLRFWQSENANIDGKIDSVATQNYMLNAGDAALPYEPYQGKTLTASLPETVYGGTLDWGSGMLTVDIASDIITGSAIEAYGSASTGIPYVRIKTELDHGTSTTNNWLGSDRYPTSPANIAPTDNAIRKNWSSIFIYDHRFTSEDAAKSILDEETPQVVYATTTPQTIQLTPQQLDMLKGENNIWSDCGDTSLVYVADTKSYIDNKFNELQNAILAQGANI